MPVEIGSLVVRATFRAQAEGAPDAQRLQDEMQRLRQGILEEVRDLIAEAERRRIDR